MPMSHNRKITGWAAMAVLLAMSLAFGQPVPSIVGTVIDESGAPLPGVSVQLSGEALDQGRRDTITDAQGKFRFEDLPTGVYTLLFSNGAYAPQQQEVEVSIGATNNLTVVLARGELAEMVVAAGIRAANAFPTYQCNYFSESEPSVRSAGTAERRYRPICYLGDAAYAFNAPPGIRYLEDEDLLFRVDPASTALEAQEDVEALELRGAVEAATGPWSRCMEAELVETTIDTRLRARAPEKNKLQIRPLVRIDDAPPGEQWVLAESDEPIVQKMGLHPTDWRWRITGIRPGRTQLALRLYAVAVLEESAPGEPVCAPYVSREPDGSRRRTRTLQRRLDIDVSAAQWVDASLPSPLLWSLLLAPAGLVLAVWRRVRATPVLVDDSPPGDKG